MTFLLENITKNQIVLNNAVLLTTPYNKCGKPSNFDLIAALKAI